MPLLLNPPESPLPCRETPDEFEAINSSFLARIHTLFNALHDFETSRDGDAFIRADGLQPAIRIINQSFDIYPSCLHRNFHSRRLFLRDDHDEDHPATSLPQLLRVTKLRLLPREDYASAVEYANARPVSPRLPLQLATRCPNLRELDCPWLWERTPSAFRLRLMREFTQPWKGPWRDARLEFARAVRELGEQLPTSLRVARLWFWKPSAFYMEDDQSVLMPDLVWPESADPLSLGLRELASHLEEFDVRAFVTPDLFREPVKGEPEGGFEVTEEHYPPESPSELDDDMDEEYVGLEGTDEEAKYATDMFRTEPLSSKIEPLLLAFAEALKGMPALEEAVFAYLAWQPSEKRQGKCGKNVEAPFNMDRAIYRWGVSYAPGKNSDRGIVTWQVGAWRPQENIIRVFESLDDENGEVKTVWKPLEFLHQRNDLNPIASR
ncbi:hypothetical protein N8I77_011423 [Diaporthe amygdali]|uniref:Uncharacterized protein n=1 Tax=Phomopsis amygdali TaxID=1214568 RepID=A0AAD9VYD3_PHOAM|nr:hypothetical protein N8I77_011423 [Diaporthe amygdali]